MSTPWIAAFVTLWALVLVLAVVQIGMLRRVLPAIEGLDRIAPRTQGPPEGSTLPEFQATTPSGRLFSSTQLRGQASILLFLTSGCPPCRVLTDELRRNGHVSLGADLLVVMDAESTADLNLPPGIGVLLQRERQVANALLVTASPFAVGVDARGVVIATGFPDTAESLRQLASRLTAATTKAGGGEVIA